MEINRRTFDKFLKEVLPEIPEENRIKVVGLEAQNRYIEQLFEENINQQEKISTSLINSSYRTQKGTSRKISFRYRAKDEPYSLDNYFYLEFYKDYLILYANYRTFYLSDVADLQKVEKRYREICAEAYQKEVKRDKIRQLKANAVIASVREIADELDVDYNYQEQKNRILIFIRISKNNSSLKNQAAIVPKHSSSFNCLVFFNLLGLTANTSKNLCSSNAL